MSPQVLHLGRHAGLLSEKVHVGRSKNLVKPIEEANGPLSKIPLILNLGALLARIRLWGFLIVYMYKEHEGIILAVVETAGRLSSQAEASRTWSSASVFLAGCLQIHCCIVICCSCCFNFLFLFLFLLLFLSSIHYYQMLFLLL